MFGNAVVPMSSWKDVVGGTLNAFLMCTVQWSAVCAVGLSDGLDPDLNASCIYRIHEISQSNYRYNMAFSFQVIVEINIF